MTAQHFYRRVLLEAGRPGLADAKRVTAAVFHALRDRLTPDEADRAFYERVRGEADDVLTQLPKDL